MAEPGQLAPAWIGLGQVFRLRGDVWLAVHHFENAVAVDPNSFEALLNLGETLKAAKALNPAYTALLKAVALRPRDPRALVGLAGVAYEKGLLDLAVACLRATVEIQPAFPDAWNDLGNALRDRGDADAAYDCYLTALRYDPNHADALNGLANERKDRGFVDEAARLYLRAIELRPDFAFAHNNYAALMHGLNRREEALRHYRESVRLRPDFIDARVNMACAFREYGRRDEAEECASAAVQIDPTNVRAYCFLAALAEDIGDFVTAMMRYSTAAALDPSSADVICGIAHCARVVCDWSEFERHERAVARATSAQLEARRIPSLSPHRTMLFSSLSHETRKEIAASRAAFAASRNATAGIVREYAFTRQRDSSARIRVGYVSSDFGDHPTTHLMRSVPGLHDRAEFDVRCYALNPDDGTAFRSTLAVEVEAFVDLSTATDGEAADMIRKDCIDVLVDMNGHTKGARSEIFALRPAPITAMWLGYPGTSGAEYLDYLICDEVICPESLESLYVEKLARLPNSCFVGDHARMFPHLRSRIFLTENLDDEVGIPADGAPILNGIDTATLLNADGVRIDLSDSEPTTAIALQLPSLDPIREMIAIGAAEMQLPCGTVVENGLVVDPESARGENVPRRVVVTCRSQYCLPDDAVVYCNFNQLYKLDPRTLDLWIEILTSVPNSILWLLRFPPCGEANLRTEVARRGLSGDRLVFSDVAVKEEHVRRGQLADVCLDTLLCNGHTTSLDALWAGTPVVTMPSETFASRVTASQLTALGCSELIAKNLDDYKDLAVRLGTDRRYLRTVREKVWKGCEESSLFDPRLYARGLEALYSKMLEKFWNGEEPSHLKISASEKTAAIEIRI